ncbi:DUF983 domain-containing protein [Devosia nitrariae]|uniref:DUF983 domain-containing protein n=1 Tax=Devosia nitrariae TaxID=2071872 RepID=A0ABQ5WD36_9HYPH|nr:DUF983 domain-containing protein [Devosia nitrariae]GLQ57511.1 hypothetical protein GCM10010862_47700 [Devosia nitrariae]
MSVEIGVADKRSVGDAMWKGGLCRCPKCGEGKLFRAYLKVDRTCSACGEEFFHHRADDLPPYVAIFVVGHVLVGLMLHMEMVWRVHPMTYIYTMVPLAIILPLLMLPSIKGAIVGLQWALRMHGFDPDHRDPAQPEYP